MYSLPTLLGGIDEINENRGLQRKGRQIYILPMYKYCP